MQGDAKPTKPYHDPVRRRTILSTPTGTEVNFTNGICSKGISLEYFEKTKTIRVHAWMGEETFGMGEITLWELIGKHVALRTKKKT